MYRRGLAFILAVAMMLASSCKSRDSEEVLRVPKDASLGHVLYVSDDQIGIEQESGEMLFVENVEMYDRISGSSLIPGRPCRYFIKEDGTTVIILDSWEWAETAPTGGYGHYMIPSVFFGDALYIIGNPVQSLPEGCLRAGTVKVSRADEQPSANGEACQVGVGEVIYYSPSQPAHLYIRSFGGYLEFNRQ